MNALLLALAASLSWGVADFVGPWQGRSLGAIRVLFWAELSGAIGIGTVVAIRGHGPAGWDVLYALPAAAAASVGIYAYYRGMAVGAMAVVAPIAGASAIVPVLFGVATGDRPSALQYVGMASALAGVTFASREHRPESSRKVAAGVGLALLAAVGFGFYFPPMHVAGSADPYWASLIFRVTSTLLIGTAAAITRPNLRLGGKKLAIVAGVGLGDATGNAMFAASAHAGGLVSLTAVLASLYPIITILLAAVVLKERVARSQRAGIVLTLAGVALISA